MTQDKPWYKPSVDYDTHRELLEAYAADHDGWRYQERNGSGHASKLFETAKAGHRVLVSIGCDERSLNQPARYRSPKPRTVKFPGFRAYLNVAFSAGPIDETHGSIEDCDAWVTRYIKVLGIANEILNATTMAKAAELVSKLTPRETYVVCDALDLPEGNDLRQTLMQASKAYRLPPFLLAKFVDDRRGWSIAKYANDRRDGWSATRIIQVLDTDYRLWVLPNLDSQHGDHGWMANAMSDGFQVASFHGSAAEVIDEVTQLEKTLDLVGQLRGCKTRLQVKSILDNVRGQQLDMLRRACGVGGGSAANVRNAISLAACGISLA